MFTPLSRLCACSAVVLENHVVTDDDEPALKRQRLEINCQDPSIKVPCGSCVHCVISYHQLGLRIVRRTLLQLHSGRAMLSGILGEALPASSVLAVTYKWSQPCHYSPCLRPVLSQAQMVIYLNTCAQTLFLDEATGRVWPCRMEMPQRCCIKGQDRLSRQKTGGNSRFGRGQIKSLPVRAQASTSGGSCDPPPSPEVCWLGLEAPHSVSELLPDLFIWDPVSANR